MFLGKNDFLAHIFNLKPRQRTFRGAPSSMLMRVFISNYRKALELDPQQAHAADALKRLKN
jgi:hypothetical protein